MTGILLQERKGSFISLKKANTSFDKLCQICMILTVNTKQVILAEKGKLRKKSLKSLILNFSITKAKKNILKF